MVGESKAFTGTAEIRFQLTPIQVDHILFALTVMWEVDEENHWYGDVWVYGTMKGEYVFQEVALGGTVYFREKSTGNVYYLNTERLMGGVGMWLNRDFELGKFDCNRIWQNPEIANRIVQYSLFEEVKY